MARLTVRRVFAHAVIVAGGQLLDRDLLERTARDKGVPLTKTVQSRRGGAREEKVPLTELARQVGFPDALFFASQHEAKRWVKLLERQTRGDIEQLRRQVPFALHAWNPQGLKVQICTYVADFTYQERDPWATVYEDSKGMPVPEYELKRKWVEAEYGIVIREV